MASCLEMYNQNTEHKSSSAGAGAPPPPPPIMSPRISFSNDFVESSQYSHSNSLSLNSSHHHHQIRAGAAAAAYRDAPVSPDFEFSVSNYSMMSADELFFKGRLLPLKESSSSSSNSCSSTSSNFQFQKTTTLRDELLHNNDNDDDDNNNNSHESFSLRPPKNPIRWRRGFLGLRKSHIGSKKSDKSLEKKTTGYNNNNNNNNNIHDDDYDDDVQCSKNSQDFVD